MKFIDTKGRIAEKLQLGIFEAIQGRIRDVTLSGIPERFLEGLTKKRDCNIRLNFKRLNAQKAEYERLKSRKCDIRLKLQKAES